MLRALQLFGFGVSPLQRWKTTDLFFTFIPIPRPRSRLGLLLPSVSLPNRRFFRRFHIDMSASCFGSNADSEVSSSSTVLPSMAHKRKINFCQSCGGPTKHVIPEGEEKMRAVCTLCEKIYYENPKMVVGGLIEHNDKILLCKRKIQPSYGLWTLPAGFMEIGESAAEGATRETLEEACAEVEVLSPFAQLDIPLIGQSYIIFRAKLKKPHFAPGPESLECALFSLNDIPFDSLAFSSIFVTLKMYIEDVKTGKLKFHYCTINKRSGVSPSDMHNIMVSDHFCL